MPALGNLQIDCACGDTLSVPVTMEPAAGPPVEPNTLNVSLRLDHAFIAAHLATHP
jgi:hypothetical protein